MTNVIILHGKNCTPEMFWYPYIKENLGKRGYDVWLPLLPNNCKADLNEWLPFILENGIFTKDTIIIGHSAGASLILAILEKLNCKIKQAILVGGASESKVSKLHLKDSYNWEKIKSNVDDIIFINSDNDSYGCGDDKGKIMFDKLGGTLIIRHGEGHM